MDRPEGLSLRFLIKEEIVKISYDPTVDALYIRFVEGPKEVS
ncbi:MAG: DUF2283 domain-containing protein [Planctomycetes bacterium]|nr:DUF2283 domain-containing protein [Planctomycetota bacterium]